MKLKKVYFCVILILNLIFQVYVCIRGVVLSPLDPSPAFALSFTGVTGANADFGLIGSEVPPHPYPFFN